MRWPHRPDRGAIKHNGDEREGREGPASPPASWRFQQQRPSPTARQAATSAALTTVPLAACFQVNSRPLPPISSRSPDRSRSIHPSTTLSRSGPSGQTILISSTEST
ncbi:hypothetical protein AX14_001095 [Amanita brunnescens Koide BX004]|nr:hypothetical protein AX14_001095 [Amanita brunnescens Koide BX004]